MMLIQATVACFMTAEKQRHSYWSRFYGPLCMRHFFAFRKTIVKTATLLQLQYSKQSSCNNNRTANGYCYLSTTRTAHIVSAIMATDLIVQRVPTLYYR